MKCVVCKIGETRPGQATVTLERDGLTIVTRGVPAQVCSNCGEEYIEESVTANLLRGAESALQNGAQVEVRQYREPAVAL